MTYKQILTPYLTPRSGKCGFAAAAVIAKRFNAHMDVVYMRQRLLAPGSSYYPIAAIYIEENIEALTEAENKIASDLESLFTEQCATHSIEILDGASRSDDAGATASWAEAVANLPHDLAVRARVADITFMAKPQPDAPGYEIDLIAEIIFQSGGPVLIVDDDAMTKFPETVFVAWNGGREAARALGASIPILKQAQHVFVATIGEPEWACEPPETVAAYLKLHGVHATALHLKRDKNAEVDFLELAKIREADLIVMGAYSHSRWREVVLGGFTRHMLHHSAIPLLMAH
jgi:nucleotide-binding universal stress UspA family protein